MIYLYKGGFMHFGFLKKYTAALFFLLTVSAAFQAGCSEHTMQHATSKHRFDNIEHWVRMFEDPERDRWQKPADVVRVMNLRPGDVVVDLGAGTGYFTRRFAVAVGPSGKAIGLDVEPGMVEYMREDAKKLGLDNYSARAVSSDDPELAPGSVDVLFLCNTYHHIDNRSAYFRKAAESLKPGGRVINVDFYKDTDFGPPRDHKIASTVVIEEMKLAGYRLIQSHRVLPEQYFLEFQVEP